MTRTLVIGAGWSAPARLGLVAFLLGTWTTSSVPTANAKCNGGLYVELEDGVSVPPLDWLPQGWAYVTVESRERTWDTVRLQIVVEPGLEDETVVIYAEAPRDR